MKDKTDLYLSLLRYALRKKGKREGHDYHIARKGKACRPVGFCEFCLQENEDNSWTVYLKERDKECIEGVFGSSRCAIKFFYWRLISDPGPWGYREEWERDTGLQF